MDPLQSSQVSLHAPDNQFKVDMLTVALLMSSIMYAFCLILSQRKLRVLNRVRPEMGTKKLLVLSVGLVCAVRIMTILGVAAMNIANLKAHYSLQPTHEKTSLLASSNVQDKDQEFYDKAMTVLFDLPNCIVVSTYVLLTLVWAECFLESRFHTESAVAWRRQWLLFYMMFNSALYGTQLILYTCIFFAPSSDHLVRTILYVAITGINFTAVSIVLVLYIYLSVHFSGFPFRSDQYRNSLSKLSSVMSLWSVTRIIWGVATLLVFIYKIELLQDSHTPVWSFVVLLLLFFVCEILPIIAMLDYSYMNMLGFERASPREDVDPHSPQRQIDFLYSRQPLLDAEGHRVRWEDQE